MKLRYECENTNKTDSGGVKTRRGNAVIRAAALGVALAVAPGLIGCTDKPKKDETAQADKKQDKKTEKKKEEPKDERCFYADYDYNDGYGDGEWNYKYDIVAKELENAISEENVDDVKEAADKMKDVNSPIHYKSNAIEYASLVSNVEVVGALLERGGKVTKKALWNASRIDANWVEGDPVEDGVFELLLNNGGKEIIQSDKKFGETLLIGTLRYQEYEAAKLLVETGVDVNTVNERGESPLYIAMLDDRSKEMIELLKSKGAKEVIPHDKCTINFDIGDAIFAKNTYILKKLVDAGADVNQVLSNGMDVLKNACMYGNSEMVSYLLDNGAVLTEDALETAAVLSDNNKPDSIKKFEVVMKNGGEEIIRSGGGAGALADAATEGDIKAVEMMIEAGASKEAIRGAYWAALQFLDELESDKCCKEQRTKLQERIKVLKKARDKTKALEKECLSEIEKSDTRGIERAIVDSILSGKTPSAEIKEALDDMIAMEENLRKLEEMSKCMEKKTKPGAEI